MEKAGVPGVDHRGLAGHYSAAFTMATYVHANPEDLAAGLASIYRTQESS